jgi:hypothetical protein
VPEIARVAWRCGLQFVSQIWGNTDDVLASSGAVAAESAADYVSGREPNSHADVDARNFAALVDCPAVCQHGEAGTYRPLRIVLVCLRVAKIRHCTVAGVATHVSSEPDDRVTADFVKTPLQPAQVFGIHLRRKTGGLDHVIAKGSHLSALSWTRFHIPPRALLIHHGTGTCSHRERPRGWKFTD